MALEVIGCALLASTLRSEIIPLQCSLLKSTRVLSAAFSFLSTSATPVGMRGSGTACPFLLSSCGNGSKQKCVTFICQERLNCTTNEREIYITEMQLRS